MSQVVFVVDVSDKMLTADLYSEYYSDSALQHSVTIGVKEVSLREGEKKASLDQIKAW